MTASPEQLIAYVYEVGAASCAQKDADRARRALQVLSQSLNYDIKDVSPVFYDVYRYINHLVNRRKFDEAKKAFDDLKQTWAKAYNLN
jgi:flagellin-specific chaperone FliS